MAKTLELHFLNEDGKTTKLTIDNPIEPMDVLAIDAAMDSILTANVFISTGGEYVSKKGARLIERNVSDIELP
ncbi:DUF2922 domain-containing protein [Bacillus sp. HMF5848]|nr:DUF2922 domain-containing protein [Bacillus sp. HMF5848]